MGPIGIIIVLTVSVAVATAIIYVADLPKLISDLVSVFKKKKT